MIKHAGETSYKATSLGIIPRSQLVLLEIEGIKMAWDFILRKRNEGALPLTSEFIRQIHEVGFGWIFPKMGGKYRSVEVSVSHHIPPKFYLVPQLMTDFCGDICVRMKHLPNIEDEKFLAELIDMLSWAHHRFSWIHPFQDYNGRVGRLLNNVALLNLDLPPIELKVDTVSGRRRYINALQNADNHDYESLKKIIGVAIEESVKELQ